MNIDQARELLIQAHQRKAQDALVEAERNLAAGSPGLATNRIYYACFYAATAVLMSRELQFVRHSSLKSAIHSQFVRQGELSLQLAAFFEEAFVQRHEADYNALASFDPAKVAPQLVKARQFVAAMETLLSRRKQD